MKFNSWSQERLDLGMKRLTSRKKSQPQDPDVDYVVGPLCWGFIRDFLWKDEGAFSPDELQTVINEIFRRVVKDDEEFYVHVLKVKEQ